jgi:hypothetical protein
MLVRREQFLEVGGFNESLETSEDYELCVRLRGKGYRIMSDPSVRAVHLAPPKSIKELYKKELWHGKEMVRALSGGNIAISKSLIYAVHLSMCLIGTVISLGLCVANVSCWPLAVFGGLLVASPFVLALRTALKDGAYKELFHMTALYAIYGFARAICLIRLRQNQDRKGSRW